MDKVLNFPKIKNSGYLKINEITELIDIMNILKINKTTELKEFLNINNVKLNIIKEKKD